MERLSLESKRKDSPTFKQLIDSTIISYLRASSTSLVKSFLTLFSFCSLVKLTLYVYNNIHDDIYYAPLLFCIPFKINIYFNSFK